VCELLRVKASPAPESATPATFGITVRPYIWLFVAAFALNLSPHEAAHAITVYARVNPPFQMWVTQMRNKPHPRKLRRHPAAGVQLVAVGVGSWLLYKKIIGGSRPAFFS